MGKHILYGASGHAKVILDAMELCNIDNICLLDDNADLSKLGKYSVDQKVNIELSEEDKMLVSIGNNKIRKALVSKLDIEYYSVIHPKTVLANTVHVHSGSFIAAGVVINIDTIIGRHVILNTNASIDHDCKIGDFVHIAPNATLCGGVTIGEGTLIGAGATILPNVKIGSWVTVGAGAVITKNIADGVKVVGNNRIITK